MRFQLGDHEYVVEEVVDEWYGPDATFFKVRADDGNLYILRYCGAGDKWSGVLSTTPVANELAAPGL